jgi:DNA polymerase III delta prime subunit
MSLRTTMPEGEPASVSTETPIDLPWLVAPLRTTLATRAAHALLLYGSGNVGQLELALALAKGWLCEDDSRALPDRPCGRCASCRLHAARSHPDLLVLVPEALRDALGWDAGRRGRRKRRGRQEKAEQGHPRRGGSRRDRLRDDDVGARARQVRRRPSGGADERRSLRARF